MPVDAPATDTPAPKQRKKPVWLIIVIAIVLLAGTGGFLFLRHERGPSKPELSKTAEYYTLDPSIVVNFTDARAIRFLQVGVSLMSHDPAAIDAAKAAEPAIRNSLLLLFSNQDYATLSTAKGKQQLQNEALAKVQGIVKQSLGRPGIEAVYFTAFVMQ